MTDEVWIIIPSDGASAKPDINAPKIGSVCTLTYNRYKDTGQKRGENKMKTTRVVGTHDAGQVMLFALSTCGWCRKARQLLESNNVGYDFVYVDLAQGAEKDEVMRELAKWTSRQGFPTTVVNDEVIIGYDEEKLKKALKL
jgi:glutaredoxin-like protein NrdH